MREIQCSFALLLSSMWKRMRNILYEKAQTEINYLFMNSDKI